MYMCTLCKVECCSKCNVWNSVHDEKKLTIAQPTQTYVFMRKFHLQTKRSLEFWQGWMLQPRHIHMHRRKHQNSCICRTSFQWVEGELNSKHCGRRFKISTTFGCMRLKLHDDLMHQLLISSRGYWIYHHPLFGHSKIWQTRLNVSHMQINTLTLHFLVSSANQRNCLATWKCKTFRSEIECRFIV